MKSLIDIEEIIDGLRKAGYDAVKIDDSLPLYDVKVKCGSPSELGYVQKVMMQTPSMLRDAGAEFGVTAMGESMIDCNVEEGDFLWIDTRAAINDCDKVLAFWDGKSRGTKQTLDYAERRGKPVKIIRIWTNKK